MPDFATVEPKVEIRIPNVPAKLRRDFKALCASRGKTMGRRLQELIRDDLEAMNDYEDREFAQAIEETRRSGDGE